MEQNKESKFGRSSLMKAIRQHEFGCPEVLRYEDAPIPELKPGEVRVRVHAIGLNPPDWYLRDGYKMLPPEWQPKVDFPVILGTDISGVIEAVADDVKGFSIGDEVYSMVRFPSYGPARLMPSTSPLLHQKLRLNRPASIMCIPRQYQCHYLPLGSS